MAFESAIAANLTLCVLCCFPYSRFYSQILVSNYLCILLMLPLIVVCFGLMKTLFICVPD